MFILSNIHDRPYRSVYPNINNVIFDISDKQLDNAKNRDWKSITKESIVCVVRSSRRISTFFQVEENIRTNNSSEDGYAHVLIGKVIAKILKDEEMDSLLNRFNIHHPYLPNNKFSIGFNVADLGDQLGQLIVKSKDGEVRLESLDGNSRQ